MRVKGGATVDYLYLTKKDVAAVIKFKGKAIGIASRGDSRKQVEHGLKFFRKHNCKVVVCATRTSGESLKAAEQYSATVVGNAPEKWEKSKNKSNIALANEKFAKRVVRWLKRHA